MKDIKKSQAENTDSVGSTDGVQQFKPQHFSEYIRNRHIQFLDVVDTIDGVAVTPSEYGVSFLNVLINGSFYTVGMIDYVDGCTVRLCGELVGFDGLLSDVNVFMRNFYDFGSVDGIQLIGRHLRHMIDLMDCYMSSDLPFQYHNCNVYLER